MSEVTIYALEDPDTGEVRYIGQTRCGVDKRLHQHLVTREGNATKLAWLEDLDARQARPAVKTLAVVTAVKTLAVVTADEALAAEAEHIRAHVARGCPLTNATHNPLATLPRRTSYIEDFTYRTAARFSAEAGEELERVAKELGVAPAVAVRLWVMEKLRSMRDTAPAHDRRQGEAGDQTDPH